MLNHFMIDSAVDQALQEDLHGGDLTTFACVDPLRRGIAVSFSKSELVVCGSKIFERVFKRLDPLSKISIFVEDGSLVPAKTELWKVESTASILLQAERTALNFVQRMSGIATLTHQYVGKLPTGSKTRITDTRKTTPGLRSLERYAVRTGGGYNHRNDLSSAIMIKDNHISAAGGIVEAIERSRAYAPHTTRIEVEVQSFEQLDLAIASKVDIIMLDNFSDDQLPIAVKKIRHSGYSPIIEVSGNISLDRIGRIAKFGVDIISVGALTHSAPSADISLDIRLDLS